MEEKVVKVEAWFHEHPEPYVLKELISHIPKATGVIFQSIPEVVELLVAENRIFQEKIGIQTLIWWFPTTREQEKKKQTQPLATTHLSSTSGNGGGGGGAVGSARAAPQPRGLLHHILVVPRRALPSSIPHPPLHIIDPNAPCRASSGTSGVAGPALVRHYTPLPLVDLRLTRDHLTRAIQAMEQRLQSLEQSFSFPSRRVRLAQEAAIQKLLDTIATLQRQHAQRQRSRVGGLHRPGAVVGCAAGTRMSLQESSRRHCSAIAFPPSPRVWVPPPAVASAVCRALRNGIAIALNASQRWTDNFFLLEEDVLSRRPHLTSDALRQMIIGDAKECKDGQEGHELDLLTASEWRKWEPYLPIPPRERLVHDEEKGEKKAEWTSMRQETTTKRASGGGPFRKIVGPPWEAEAAAVEEREWFTVASCYRREKEKKEEKMEEKVEEEENADGPLSHLLPSSSSSSFHACGVDGPEREDQGTANEERKAEAEGKDTIGGDHEAPMPSSPQKNTSTMETKHKKKKAVTFPDGTTLPSPLCPTAAPISLPPKDTKKEEEEEAKGVGRMEATPPPPPPLLPPKPKRAKKSHPLHACPSTASQKELLSSSSSPTTLAFPSDRTTSSPTPRAASTSTEECHPSSPAHTPVSIFSPPANTAMVCHTTPVTPSDDPSPSPPTPFHSEEMRKGKKEEVGKKGKKDQNNRKRKRTS